MLFFRFEWLSLGGFESRNIGFEDFRLGVRETKNNVSIYLNLLYICCRHVRAEGKASVEDRTRVEGETKAEKQKWVKWGGCLGSRWRASRSPT